MSLYEGDTGEEYYNMRQARRSDFVQKRRAEHFQPHIKNTDTVLDFGCGTGGVLEHIQCAEKIGVEVNELSVKEAKEKGIQIYASLDDAPENCADVIISNHALEHVTHPAEHITKMLRVLKQGGKIVLVVPAESPASHRFSNWEENDPDQHIYSWTPLSFGNLIHQCGFEIEKSFRRPIGYSKFVNPIAKYNEGAFQLARRAAAFILGRYEVVCIAKKA